MLREMVIDGIEVSDEPAPRDHAAELLALVASRDQDAFARLYDMLSDRVFGLILRVLVNRAQSEEVLQEVFLEIWQSAASFAPNKGQGRTWIMTIAHRRAVDRVRSAEASSRRETVYHDQSIERPHDSTAEAAHASLEARRVRSALATLTDTQRGAVELAYFGGYSQREISALLDTPLGTIKTRIRDGLTRLRKELEATR